VTKQTKIDAPTNLPFVGVETSPMETFFIQYNRVLALVAIALNVTVLTIGLVRIARRRA
jgi:hypothetical protein